MSSKYYEQRNSYINNWVDRLNNSHSKSVSEDLNELIETANKLSNRLDDIAKDEIKFCEELGNDLERLSWETFCLCDDLKNIQTLTQVEAM